MTVVGYLAEAPTGSDFFVRQRHACHWRWLSVAVASTSSLLNAESKKKKNPNKPVFSNVADRCMKIFIFWSAFSPEALSF